MKFNGFFCSLLLVTQLCFSQLTISKAYTNYHQYSQEDFHLRFNKEAYYPGEKAWFQVFVTDSKTKKLFSQTKKACLLIYNEEGRLLTKKYLKFTEAASSSFIEIPHTYKSSHIFYKIVTNWSKNFNRDELNTLKVHLKDQENNIELPLKEILFFPESGKIVNTITSFIGVKAVDIQGNGMIVNGVIKDTNDKTVGVFKTDPFGVGKFRFRPIANQKYFAVITEDSKYRKFELPKAQDSGVIINVVEKENTVLFYFKSKNFAPKSGTSILIHYNGSIALSSPITLKNGQGYFSLPKEKLLKGMNAIAIFDGKKLLAERHFFNDSHISKNTQDVLVQAKRVSNDTVEFHLSKKLQTPQLHLSVSIVPKENLLVKSNDFKSDYYLKELQGFSSKKINYFESQKNISRINTHLLSSGSQKNTWQKILQQDTISIKHYFDTGFDIKGRLLDRKKNGVQYAELKFYADQKIGSVNTDSLGYFTIKNLDVTIEDRVLLTTKKGRGNRKKITYEMVTLKEPLYDTIINIKKTQLDTTKNKVNSLVVKDRELLKEVVVTGNAQAKEQDLFINPLDRSSFNESFEVTKEKITQYRDVLSYLMTRPGIRVINNAGMIYIFSTRSKHQTILGQNSIGSRGTGSPGNMMNVYINRSIIRGNQLEVLKEITLDQVKSVKINRSGVGDGGINPFGSINIYLTTKSIFGLKNLNSNNNNLIKHVFLAETGFTKPIPYQSPNYIYDPYSMEYKKHATLYWKPDIKLKEEPVTFLVEIPKSINEYKIVIQGITSDGDIIDFTKYISLK